MSEPAVLHEGALGPHAGRKIAALADAKLRIDAQIDETLALVAEAQGFVLDGCRVKFDYDTEAGTYKVLGAPEEGAVRE